MTNIAKVVNQKPLYDSFTELDEFKDFEMASACKDILYRA